MMSIEAWSSACFHLTRAGGRAVSHGAVFSACHQYDGVFMHQPPGERHRMESIRAVNTACHHYDGSVNWGISPPLVGRLRIENTKSVGSVCYHHDNGSCFEASRRRAGGGAYIINSESVGTAYHAHDSASCMVSSRH